MKKYLISGFNTVQGVKLEVGTYTLVAYVKSMHGEELRNHINEL